MGEETQVTAGTEGAETTAAATAAATTTATTHVPYDRFKEVNDAKKAAEAREADLAARLKAIEDKEKSDLQKAQESAAEHKAQLDQLNATIATERRTNAAMAAAAKAGWADPATAAKLIDWSRAEDDGSNVEALVSEYATANAWVIARPSGSANGGTRSEQVADDIDAQIAQAEKDAAAGKPGAADREIMLKVNKARGAF
jgi:hypothetical protein